MTRPKGSRTVRFYKVAPYAVLGLALIVLGTFVALASNVTDREEKANLENDSLQIQQKITERISQQSALLRGAAGLFAANPAVLRSDFRKYARSLRLGSVYEGTASLGYAERVPSNAIGIWEGTARREDGRPIVVSPSLSEKPRSEAYPLLYIEPINETNQAVLGFDMMTNDIRRLAMETARDGGEPTLSGLVRFYQDKKGKPQFGFCLYMPVYKGGKVPDLQEDRRRALTGFIYSPFTPDKIFVALFKGAPSDLSVKLYDDVVPVGGTPFFSRSIAGHPSLGEERTSDFDVAGHRWTIKVAHSGGVDSSLLGYLPYVGGSVCLVVFFLALAQSREREKTERALSELEHAERGQRLLAQVGALLSQSLDYSDTLSSVADLIVPDFADWVAIDMLKADGSISRLVTKHVDTDKIQSSKEFRLRWRSRIDDTTWVATVLRTGEPQYIPEVTEEFLVKTIKDPEQLEFLRELEMTSIMSVPIVNGGRVHGALTLVFAESQCHFTKSELELAQEIGMRSGLAVENSLNAEAAREELEVRKAAEENVRRLNEGLEILVEERTRELAAANKELEAFCYSVSHDLRAPLRSVDGFTKATLDDYGDSLDTQAREYLLRVRNAAKRMDELITALLVLSRITRSEMKRENVDISQLAIQTIEELSHGIVTGLVTHVDKEMRAVADPDMAHLVLDNLIGNAIKFSSKAEAPRVEVGIVKTERGQTFYVKDNGAGFNPAYANKLFVPFERLHSNRDFPGSGIGLATVQRIVQKHGGEVWADSEEGKGATFYFTLG